MSAVVVDRGLHQLLYDAIENKRLIRFRYNNQERIVEPHDYGIQRGIPRLLSWQIGGQSNGRLPGWRWFDVVEVKDLEMLDRLFPGNRDMTTMTKLFSAIALICSLATAQNTPKPSEAALSVHAQKIHSSALVIDTHADTPQRFLDEGFDIGSTDPNDIGHISLDKAHRGNLGAEFFSIWVEPETNQGRYARHTFDLIDSVYEQAARHPDRMMMAFSTSDIERAHHEHKLAALMGIEGGHSIEADIHLLRDYYRLGVRYMGERIARGSLCWRARTRHHKARLSYFRIRRQGRRPSAGRQRLSLQSPGNAEAQSDRVPNHRHERELCAQRQLTIFLTTRHRIYISRVAHSFLDPVSSISFPIVLWALRNPKSTQERQ